jgi:Rrf2 family transcriptional regulator, nitric oxide-sensitive transcriptional repressor
MVGVSDHGEEPLRLSLLTDLALRSLMYLAANDGRARVSTSHIAQRFRISKFHLQKAVQALRKLGYVGITSGRFGGLSLAVPASNIRIGSVVATLESMGHLVNCNKGPCPLDGACPLKLPLDRPRGPFSSSSTSARLRMWCVVQPQTRSICFSERNFDASRANIRRLVIAAAALTARSYPSRLGAFCVLA